MKEYKIQLEETVVEFLEYISKSQNVSIEEVIQDVVFNQVANVIEQISKAFIVSENDL